MFGSDSSGMIGRGIRPEMPVLSSAEEAPLVNQFLAEVRRELTIVGRLDQAADVKLAGIRERVVVNPKLSGAHEVRYRSLQSGGQLNVKQTVREVIEQLDERATLLSFGPDPVALLVERLIQLGIAEGDARLRAAGRVHRLEDGRVAARGLYDGGPAPVDGRQYTPAQLEVLRNPNEAISRAARAILAEIGSSSPQNRDMDAASRQKARSRVMGSF